MNNINIKFDENLPENFIEIVAKEDCAIIRKIESFVKDNYPNTVTCFKNNQAFKISIDEIYRIYCRDTIVILKTEKLEYEIKERLYEIENKLGMFSFIKINKGEIINLNKVNDFDFTYSGKVLVHLKNDDICNVSRRNINKLKMILGV